MRHSKSFWRCLPALLVVVACQPLPVQQPPAQASVWPTFDYQAAATAGQRVYRLVPEESRVDIVVRRGGPLARFGHDHVIVASSIEGWVYWPDKLERALAELRIPVATLEVDDPEARQRYSFDTQPSPDAIEGTRHNMLEKVLDAGSWPYVTVAASHPVTGPDGWRATLAFTVKDHTTTMNLPLRVTVDQDRLESDGSFEVNHADLGLEPFSALAGALQVADPLEFHFAIVAARSSP